MAELRLPGTRMQHQRPSIRCIARLSAQTMLLSPGLRLYLEKLLRSLVKQMDIGFLSVTISFWQRIGHRKPQIISETGSSVYPSDRYLYHVNQIHRSKQVTESLSKMKKGNEYQTVVTSTTFAVLEAQKIACNAASPTVNAGQRLSETSKAIIVSRKYADEAVEHERTERETALEELNRQLAESSGM